MVLKAMRKLHSTSGVVVDILNIRLKDFDMQERFRIYIDERVCVSAWAGSDTDIVDR
jgi:hypothetical protein